MNGELMEQVANCMVEGLAWKAYISGYHFVTSPVFTKQEVH